MTTRVLFDQELEKLNEELKNMSETVGQAIESTFEAFQTGDVIRAKEIIKSDRIVDEMERGIESRCLSLMLRQQPVARDLRHISTALKVVTDLERIGDHAADIAELTLHLDRMRTESKSVESAAVLKHLPAMVETVKVMLRDAITAFIVRDSDAAEKIILRDDIVDAYFIKVKREVVELLKRDGERSDQAVDLLMIAKYLERIGDHAVNVCEWTEFSDTGKMKSVRLL